jgi:hypothetical protein
MLEEGLYAIPIGLSAFAGTYFLSRALAKDSLGIWGCAFVSTVVGLVAAWAVSNVGEDSESD